VPVEGERRAVIAYTAIHDGPQVSRVFPRDSHHNFGVTPRGRCRSSHRGGPVRAEVEAEFRRREAGGLFVERRVDRREFSGDDHSEWANDCACISNTTWSDSGVHAKGSSVIAANAAVDIEREIMARCLYGSAY